MRNCLGGISSYFSSSWKNFSSSCLSCFGSPKNNPKQGGREGIKQDSAPNPASNVSAEVVFVNPVPSFNQAVDAGNDALGNQKSEAMQSSDPQNLKPQNQTLEVEIEISGQETIDPENTASTEQNIIDRKNHEIRLLNELRLFNECRIAELTASLLQLEARLNLLKYSEQGPMRKPENQTQEDYSNQTLNPQLRLNSENLQYSSSSQIYYSASEERDINSSSQWGVEGYKMLSPLIYQGSLTIKDLQDFSDPIPLNHVDDSGLNNSQSSSNFQSSTGTLTQSTETNISYFPKDDKTMERNLILLEKASTNAVDGVSDFSKVMDAITKDLKGTINDPSYPAKSIALAPSSPSPSPSSTSNNPAPRVLGVRVVGNVNELVLC